MGGTVERKEDGGEKQGKNYSKWGGVQIRLKRSRDRKRRADVAFYFGM